jgi:hypothetical protein
MPDCLTFTELLTLLLVVSGLTALPGAAIGMLLLATLQKRLGLKVDVAQQMDVEDADADVDDETGETDSDEDTRGGQPAAGGD